jgi:5-methylcytosine-specific restriction endonuclease McrA
MKNLYPIEEELVNIYKSIAQNSHGQKKINLLNELGTIKSRYELYFTNRKDLSVISKLDFRGREDIKNDLLSCYGNNVNLNNLKSDIISKQELHYQAKCPYCGINSHGTFDHYLPKEDYPDYSVLAINLIPCCEKCNSKKGTRLFNEQGERLFLNYYYDFLPEEKYLEACLFFNKNIAPTVSFKIVDNQNINIELYTIIQAHYKELNLCERFESHANDEISNLYLETQLAANEGVEAEEQRRTLERKIKTKTRSAGRNNWLVALYEAVYESTEFFEQFYSCEESI